MSLVDLIMCDYEIVWFWVFSNDHKCSWDFSMIDPYVWWFYDASVGIRVACFRDP